MVPSEPTIDDMKQVVVGNSARRPFIPPAFSNPEPTFDLDQERFSTVFLFNISLLKKIEVELLIFINIYSNLPRIKKHQLTS